LPYNETVQSPSPSTPIMVHVVERSEIAGLGDTMINAIGLTGAILAGALACGAVFAGFMIGYRKLRARREPEDEPVQTQPLGLS
jgi:hypothetical protein